MNVHPEIVKIVSDIRNKYSTDTEAALVLLTDTVNKKQVCMHFGNVQLLGVNLAKAMDQKEEIRRILVATVGAWLKSHPLEKNNFIYALNSNSGSVN